MKVILMNEQNDLLESKVITFKGETSPEFGWAVVLAGGAGSGKGYVLKHRVLLPSKTIDVDELKKQYLKLKIANPEKYKDDGISFEDVDEEIKDKIKNHEKLTKKEIKKVITTILNNHDYVSKLHAIVKKKRWKDMVIDSFLKESNKDRLPNVIFDMTGDEEQKLIDTAKMVKNYGYKTALVWVVTNFKVAKQRNATRDRKVSDDILASTHRGARSAVSSFLEKSIATKCYDEIWLVINSEASTEMELTPEETQVLQKMPCIQLEKKGNKFDFSNKTKAFLNKFLDIGNTDNSVINYLAGLANKSREKRRRQHRKTDI